MPNIYLIRHAESIANAGGTSLPNAEIPLTEKGKQQAKILSERLNITPTKIITSTFIRTQQTAQPWLAKLGRQIDKYDPLINEFNMLGYETVKGLNGQQRLPYAINYRKRANLDERVGKDGETFREFYHRVETFLNQLSTQIDNSVLFTHGMFIRLLLWRLLGMPIENQKQLQQFYKFHGLTITNTAVFRLHWQKNRHDAGIKIMPNFSPSTLFE